MATKISFVKATPLTNVRGRVNYISDPKRQEHLMGFYQTPADPATFWKELSDVTRAHTSYHQNAKKHVEAREHIVTLPYELADEDPAELTRRFAEDFKREHGVECAAALHWNSKKSTFHLHLVFSERQMLQEKKVSIAGRDTYFDADGKRSTKAKCVGADRKLLSGCRVVRKGEPFPSKSFAGKDGKFYTRSFLSSEKERYAQLFSELSNDEWVVYNYQSNPHLAQLNLIQGEPDGLRAWKEAENEKRRQYNSAIDRMIDAGELTVEDALEIKKQIYEWQIQQKNERAAEREELKRWIAEAPERREQFARENQERWYKLHYNSFDCRRSLFELVVILGLELAGIDVLKVDVGNDLIVRPPANNLKATVDPKLQVMVDQLCVAAGRKALSELAAERKIKKISAERKPSLEDLISAAESKGQNTQNNTSYRKRRSDQEL